MALMDVCGLWISSIKYRRRRDGKARKIRMSAGRAVQIVSRVFASKSCREVRREDTSVVNIYLTKVVTMVTISIA